MLDQETGHQDKFKTISYKQGDLLYWSDFWSADYGVGIFIEYVDNFNVKDIYSTNTSQLSSAWVKLLITNKDSLEIKMFPQSSISRTHNHKSLQDFREYDSKFRYNKNR